MSCWWRQGWVPPIRIQLVKGKETRREIKSFWVPSSIFTFLQLNFCCLFPVWTTNSSTTRQTFYLPGYDLDCTLKSIPSSLSYCPLLVIGGIRTTYRTTLIWYSSNSGPKLSISIFVILSCSGSGSGSGSCQRSERKAMAHFSALVCP